jgi:2',3'-cyclic-nucleotide 2'-phosphodiesterase (5'-nucleotidase family)
VILSHLGLEDDRRLADEVGGIDVIIGAHSHDRLPTGELRSNVLIAQAGQYAEAVGVISLNIDRDSGKIVSRNAAVLDVPSDTPADQAVLASIAAAEEEVKEILAQPVGELAGPLDQNFFRECDIGNLAADALRARMKAEIAIVSSGLFHRPLDGGILTLGQLDAACFSTANPWLSEVRGDQILAALDRGLDPSCSENVPHSFRGAPVGIPQISGLQVYYDHSAVEAPRIRRVLVHGQSLDLKRRYRLAHTDAEAMAGIGYLNLESGQIIEQEVPTILREVIADYLQTHVPTPAPPRGRWVPV